jgi:hypothetical protein
MKSASTLVFLASLLAVSSLQAKWSRIPIMQEKPVNVAAKGAHSSASIDSSSGIGQVDNLLNAADPTAPATLNAGSSFFIVSFGKPVMVSNSSLVNDGIEGKVALSASADKSGWAVLEEKVFSAADRSINFKFAGIQAKFLKFEFVLSKGGIIRALNVTGGQTDRGYALKQDAKGEKGQPMNFTGGLGGARLVYAAPKPVNGIDSAAAFNKFEFPESDEKYRTLIYDMGQTRVMNEFSSVHSPSPVRFEVFAFDKLPEKEDWRGRLAFDPADFNLSKPVVAYEDKVGTGHIKVKPAQVVKTRYLALRWEPDFNPPAFLIESTAAVGNVVIQGPSTRTVTINGQQVQVTVDPGPAVGAGTSESQATVTISVLNSDGSVASTVQYSGGGVTGVDISGGNIQVLTGNNPNTAPNDSPPPPVAVVNIDASGSVTTQPTAVGFVLGVQPTATSGSVTTQSAPPTTGDSGATNQNAQEIVASVLGISTDAAAEAITAVVNSGGDSTAAAAAVVNVVTTSGGDATNAQSVLSGSLQGGTGGTGTGGTGGTGSTGGTDSSLPPSPLGTGATSSNQNNQISTIVTSP